MGRAAEDTLRSHGKLLGEIARAIGRPRACRAVAQACHVNPIAIIIPCHRVIGANGRLTGYAAGLGIKQLLLDLERGIRQDLYDL